MNNFVHIYADSDIGHYNIRQLKSDRIKIYSNLEEFENLSEDKKFAILGDKGINEVVPSDFWNIIRDLMAEEFKKEQFTVGLCQGIEMAGEHLKTHFPYQKDDKNELTNEISFEG